MNPKVLYVAAWGRSGTTIVDNILDAYPGVFSAGELRYLWARGLVHGRDCGCGRPVPECPLWTEILLSAYGRHVPDARYVASLQAGAIRARHTPSLLRRAWPAEVAEYAEIMSRLYRGIREVTGADLIVDSSKLPADAAVLVGSADIDSYLLHMVRDARAVAHSWSRATPHPDRPTLMMRHSAAKSTMHWCVWNVLTELVVRHHRERHLEDRHLRLRYEDFVADPQGQIERILAFARVAVSLPVGATGPFGTRDSVRLMANHTVSGNPRRFRVGEVIVRGDEEWRTRQATRPRLAITAIGLPLLLRYRYPFWPR